MKLSSLFTSLVIFSSSYCAHAEAQWFQYGPDNEFSSLKPQKSWFRTEVDIPISANSSTHTLFQFSKLNERQKKDIRNSHEVKCSLHFDSNPEERMLIAGTNLQVIKIETKGHSSEIDDEKRIHILVNLKTGSDLNMQLDCSDWRSLVETIDGSEIDQKLSFEDFPLSNLSSVLTAWYQAEVIK